MNLLIYVICGLTALLVIMLRNLPSYRRFCKNTAKVATLSSEELSGDTSGIRNLFANESQLEVAANGALANIADAHTCGLLQDYDIDNCFKPVRAASNHVSSVARALAGIVIISGLLV